jgi:hypothetical protein
VVRLESNPFPSIRGDLVIGREERRVASKRRGAYCAYACVHARDAETKKKERERGNAASVWRRRRQLPMRASERAIEGRETRDGTNEMEALHMGAAKCVCVSFQLGSKMGGRQGRSADREDQ